MKAYTDYPMTEAELEHENTAPVREVVILKYDGDKYCDVFCPELTLNAQIKLGYLFKDANLSVRFSCRERHVLEGKNIKYYRPVRRKTTWSAYQ